MKKFTIIAEHEDDIFDLELKKIHVEFKRLGFNSYPNVHEFIKYPETLQVNDIKAFDTSLNNTWLKRNRSEEALEILQKALKRAIKQQNKVAL